jgi:hypothetical protein
MIWVSAVLTLLIFAANSYATPFGINITAWDRMGSMSESEDNEVEPSDVLAQMWDLEGFYLSRNALTIIAGFNLLTGGVYGSRTFRPGDIFISTNPSAVEYGNPPESQISENRTQANVFGYDYVLDMDYASLQYQVYRINGQTQLESVYYRQNAGANPYRYASGGTPMGAMQSFQYNASPDVTGLGLLGMGGNNFHNALTVDLGFLPVNTRFLAHITEECGNDNLVGMGNAVPEPTTVLLFGTGLLGFLGIRRVFGR